MTLAIEHTLVQPYAAYKQESARFSNVFRAIQNDRTLIVPNRGVDVFVASGALATGYDWARIASTIHDWLRESARTLPVGESNHIVAISESPPVRLLIRVIDEQDFDGDFQIGIDGSHLPDSTLSSVVEKVLKTKIEKLANTKADKRILLLERDEPTLKEDSIAAEIESKRHMIDKFDEIHEVWLVENVRSFGNSDYIRFSMRTNGKAAKILAFYRGRLQKRYCS